MAKADDWIKFPSTDQEFDEAKAIWNAKYKFPHAIGALDGTLIPIIKPKHHGDEYVCRKGYAAFNVQATCNGASKFTSVDCSWAGTVHDARVWRNSIVCRKITENNRGALLLADEGYPLTPWLMVLYRNPTTTVEQAYNQLHKKERCLIERLFGQLKRRFPMLQNTIRVATQRVPSFIIACFVLHNVAKTLNDQDFEGEDETVEEPCNSEEYVEANLLRRGKLRRNQIANAIAV